MLLTLLAGCAQDDEGGGGPRAPAERLQRVALRSVDAAPPAPEETHPVRALFPGSTDGWRIDAARHETKPLTTPRLPGDPDCLFLFGMERKEIVLPGPFDPAAFNQVVLHILGRFRATIEVQFLRNGRPDGAKRIVPIDHSAAPQRLVAGFAGNALRAEPFGELRIVVPPHAGPVCLTGVELRHEPLSRWLPAARDGYRLVAVEGELRPSVGLSSTDPLEGDFVIPPRGALIASCAVASELVLGGQDHRVHVTVEPDGGAPVRETLTIAPKRGRPARWQTVRLALDEHAGASARVRFELEVTGEADGYALVAEPLIVAAETAPSTVLLVTSDTHRGDHVDFAPQAAPVTTPGLRELAARGVTFDRTFATSNLTLPSHVALMTGMHPRDTRIIDNRTSISDAAPTLAEAFRREGFATFAAVSARHLSHAVSGLGQGFERMTAPMGQRPAEVTIARLLEWLAGADDRPVFAWLHLYDAHTPYTPHGADPASADGGLDEQRALYRGEVDYLDGELSQVLALERVRRGIVAFTSDHGEVLADHGLGFGHFELFSDTLHVPLVLAWPDAPGGTRVTTPVRNMDLGRTLLDLALIPDEGFPGENLLEQAAEDAPPARPSYAIAEAAESASITFGGMHLILHLMKHPMGEGERIRQAALHEVQMFDLNADPGCHEDLVDERPDAARSLRAQLIAWLAQTKDVGWATEPSLTPADLKELAALGYVDESDPDGLADDWFDPGCGCAWCQRFR